MLTPQLYSTNPETGRQRLNNNGKGSLLLAENADGVIVEVLAGSREPHLDALTANNYIFSSSWLKHAESGVKDHINAHAYFTKAVARTKFALICVPIALAIAIALYACAYIAPIFAYAIFALLSLYFVVCVLQYTHFKGELNFCKERLTND